MRYSVKQYATALGKSLEYADKETYMSVLERFVALLQQNRDWSKLNRIMGEVELRQRMSNGIQKVRIESAWPVTEAVRRHIREIFENKVVMEEIIKTELLAGVRLLIEDETLIDASGSWRLDMMFVKK